MHGKRFVYKFVCDLKMLLGYSAAELNRQVTMCAEKKLQRVREALRPPAIASLKNLTKMHSHTVQTTLDWKKQMLQIMKNYPKIWKASVIIYEAVIILLKCHIQCKLHLIDGKLVNKSGKSKIIPKCLRKSVIRYPQCKQVLKIVLKCLVLNKFNRIFKSWNNEFLTFSAVWKASVIAIGMILS